MTLSIQEISDRLEIDDLYARYVHAADERDMESLDLIFLPQTFFDWSAGGGGKMTYEEARRGPIFTGKLFPWTFHIYANTAIDFSDDKQTAVVKVKTLTPLGLNSSDGTPMMYQMNGVYVDTLEKTTDGWRIINRVAREGFSTGSGALINGMRGMLEAAGKSLS
ncbi:hypothetical protein BDV24DRAFT_166707 [Aspergillus arachidicola]|uniref:SnoaL-like domain-containing protein n=1 Tax=Aspergillus arachidicola TaxID=656916 RepID=A0A5N6XXW9_9EURO|nr:hypothetical protein BDV24DRAFT_166707 [Aspergillus arachidicola]